MASALCEIFSVKNENEKLSEAAEFFFRTTCFFEHNLKRKKKQLEAIITFNLTLYDHVIAYT